MLWQNDPYALPLFFAAFTSAGLALLMMRRRRLFVHLPGATTFVLLLLMIAEWSLTAGGEYMSADLSSILLWDKLSYVCIAFLPVACAAFCIQYTGRGGWLRTRILVLACFVPVVTLLLDWTNEAHHLIYSEFSLVSFGSLSILHVTYGAWFWVQLTYSYTLLLFGIALLAQQFSRSQGVPRRQSLILILSILVPLVASAFEAFPPFVDYTPLAFTFTGFGCFWAVFRFRLFEIMPVARETIVRSMADGVIVLDLSDRLVDINPAGEQVFGSGAGVIGRSAAELFEDCGLNRQCLAKASSEFSLTVRGVQRHFELNFSYLHDKQGSLVGSIGVLRDITERKKLEAQLAESQRLAAIGQFALMVGHDLRNPLQSINVAAHYLKKVNQPIDEKSKGMFEIIQKSVKYADRIVVDLSEYSKELRLEPVDTRINSIIQTAIAMSDVPSTIRAKLSENDYAVTVDTAAIQRVFTNLIRNAIDAMPQGGDLTISAAKSKGHIQINVSDTGIGVPKQIMENLGKPLQTTKAKGLGLGLAISKRIIEAHGGSLSAETAEGKGSNFTVTLPANNIGKVGNTNARKS
jgi:PAS domain S-box-containing protein